MASNTSYSNEAPKNGKVYCKKVRLYLLNRIREELAGRRGSVTVRHPLFRMIRPLPCITRYRQRLVGRQNMRRVRPQGQPDHENAVSSVKLYVSELSNVRVQDRISRKAIRVSGVEPSLMIHVPPSSVCEQFKTARDRRRHRCVTINGPDQRGVSSLLSRSSCCLRLSVRLQVDRCGFRLPLLGGALANGPPLFEFDMVGSRGRPGYLLLILGSDWSVIPPSSWRDKDQRSAQKSQ